ADVVGALASNSDYTTALSAVKAAGLDSALKTGGPYTIFAPNNAAFSKLPAGQLDSLLKDPTKLTILLKGHVVTGKYSKADIVKALNTGKGKTELTTIDGHKLILSVSSNKTLQLANASGHTTEVTLYDLIGENGIVNGVNTVLLP
ncbi:MAG: fasciclin domain-containing protein, partial [Sphingobacteriales bacterium]